MPSLRGGAASLALAWHPWLGPCFGVNGLLF